MAKIGFGSANEQWLIRRSSRKGRWKHVTNGAHLDRVASLSACPMHLNVVDIEWTDACLIENFPV